MPPIAFIAGAAQSSQRRPDQNMHPARLMTAAATAALADAGLKAGDVDAIACVEPLSWAYEDLPGVVLEELGADADARRIWVPAGGTSPLDLLHEITTAIRQGDVGCALITGSEAMKTRRWAGKQGMRLSWPERPEQHNPMRGQPPLSSSLERHYGLSLPIHVFPLFENAIGTAHHRTAQEQRDVAASILARNASTAAHNPHAWFQDAPDTSSIASITPENRLIAYPYTKRMNAIMDVDQCACVVVVSAAFLEARGLLDRAAAILGGAGAQDAWYISERPSYDHSPAMQLAYTTALDRAGLTPDDLDAFDLYSCFPSAIQLGLTALGTQHEDQRAFSLTGGLAYAGGPGNGYVLHALATALTRLRANQTERVLVSGIGMANSKHAATILAHAAHRANDASGEVSYREPYKPPAASVIEKADGNASIVTWTVEYDRQGDPARVILLLDLESGERAIATADNTAQMANQLLARDPIGRTGSVLYDAGRNIFRFS